MIELRDHPFLANLPPEDYERLASSAELVSFPSGEIIFPEGSPSDSLWLMLEGRVSFVKSLGDNKERMVSTGEPGGFFGEVGLFTGEPRALSARAQDPVRLARIRRAALLDFIRSTPGPIDSILQSIVRHLHSTTRHYMEHVVRQEKMSVVGQMMNTIIHDFKNPFSLISISAQLMAQFHPDEQSQKLCAQIEKQIQRMVQMADEVNMFSRGQHNLNLAPVAVSTMLHNFRLLNLPYFERPGLEIRLVAEEATILADEPKMQRVLQNLVGNALEALAGRSDGVVTVDGRMLKDSYELTVTDNANGIPPEIQGRFWEAFVTYGKRNGTGLGSAIVKSLVEAHGGTIRFETQAGRGTVFHVSLPQKP